MVNQHLYYKKNLDDIIKIFKGTTKQLHKLFEEMNKLHPTLKFTITHTTPDTELEEGRCQCTPLKSIPFLDTSLSIVKSKKR